MINLQPKPYNYLVYSPDKQMYYYGLRFRNKVHASEDILKVYWTSSTRLTKEQKLNLELCFFIEFDTIEEAQVAEHNKISALIKKYGKDRFKELFLNRSNGRHVIADAETCAKMSASNRNRSAETIAKLSAAGKGKPKSPEHRAKISAALIGKIRSDETKLKISASKIGKMSGANNPFFGKGHSDEVKAKIGVKNRGKIRSDEIRAKMSANMTGKMSGANNPMVKKKLRRQLNSLNVYNFIT